PRNNPRTTRKDHMRFTTLKFWERFLRRSRRRSTPPSRRPRRRLQLEMLEDRTVPATASATVNGIVYIDANADGIRQAQETVLPGVPVNLSGTAQQSAPINLTGGTDCSLAYF